MKSATKLVQQHPPHLRHVATLPWEIKYHGQHGTDFSC